MGRIWCTNYKASSTVSGLSEVSTYFVIEEIRPRGNFSNQVVKIACKRDDKGFGYFRSKIIVTDSTDSTNVK